MSFQHDDNASFRLRLIASFFLVSLCFLCLLSRFIWLQVINREEYKAKAEDNRIAFVPIVPERGLILDRNGIILSRNYSTFTLDITPSKLQNSIEQTIQIVSNIIPITKRDITRFKRSLEDLGKLSSITLRSGLTEAEIAKISVIQNQIAGIEIKSKMMRNYPLEETASHLLGHIGRISKKDEDKIQKISDENLDSVNYTPLKEQDNYNGTSHIGKLGLEESYEFELHGLTGSQKIEVNSSGHAVRSLFSQNAQAGNDIKLSIDVTLQKLAEDLYGDNKGALVAIEPQTGEVLAFVSKPTFNPNLFVDGIDSENWKLLNDNPNKPLLNRALKGTYPAGSTYKPFMGLAGLASEKITPTKNISDPGYFTFGNHTFKDDKKGGHGRVDLYKSIVESCDTYYYTLARDMGVDAIHDFMQHFGFGQILGIDINGEARGILPSKEWKRKAYRKPEQQRWYDGETISLGIGQGYNSFTMLQLAYATATLANDGIAMQPHLVQSIYNPNTHNYINIPPKEKDRLNLNSEHLNVVKKAMQGVNIAGTSARAFIGSEYTSAAKTGTAQVFSLSGAKYNAHQLDKDLHDHALFIAFAPVENPKIALAMVVENGGFGAQTAAPIARKLLDYYLLKKLSPEANDIKDKIIQSGVNVISNLNSKPLTVNEINSKQSILDNSKILQIQKSALAK